MAERRRSQQTPSTGVLAGFEQKYGFGLPHTGHRHKRYHRSGIRSKSFWVRRCPLKLLIILRTRDRQRH